MPEAKKSNPLWTSFLAMSFSALPQANYMAYWIQKGQWPYFIVGRSDSETLIPFMKVSGH